MLNRLSRFCCREKWLNTVLSFAFLILPVFVSSQASYSGRRGPCSDPHAYFTSCGKCQLVCRDNQIIRNCPRNMKVCIASCFCKEGFVWSSDIQSGCIPESYCTDTGPAESSGFGPSEAPPVSAESALPKCGDPNAVYLECGGCAESCDRPKGQTCTTACVRGCFCRDGYVKRSDAADAPCVPPSECASSQQEVSQVTVVETVSADETGSGNGGLDETDATIRNQIQPVLEEGSS